MNDPLRRQPICAPSPDNRQIPSTGQGHLPRLRSFRLIAIVAITCISGCGVATSDEYEAIEVSHSPQAPARTDPVSTEAAPGDLTAASPAEVPAPEATPREATVQTPVSEPVVVSEGPSEKPVDGAGPERPAATTPDGTASESGTEKPVPGSTTELVAIEPREVKLLVPEKTFQKEGRERALRVTFDDIDLLRILNMEPVQSDAPKLMPDWLKGLEGQRIRLRGFMYPTFQDTGIEVFILARDNDICCFGRSPKVYDLVKVSMQDGESTDYIQGRPFDVIGKFHIAEQAVTAADALPKLYSITDAVVIAR